MSTVITIQPKNKWQLIDLAEVWRFRDLFFIFTWRDITVRYKQTMLGVIWVVFQPLLTTLIFTVFFGNLAKIPSDNMPYALFVLCGLVYWNYFTLVINIDELCRFFHKRHFAYNCLFYISGKPISVESLYSADLLVYYFNHRCGSGIIFSFAER